MASLEARLDRYSLGKKVELPFRADSKAIQRAQEKMRITFPAELKALYQCHDGSDRICVEVVGGGPQYLMSLENTINTWEMMCEIGADFEKTEENFGEQLGQSKGGIGTRRGFPRVPERSCTPSTEFSTSAPCRYLILTRVGVVTYAALLQPRQSVAIVEKCVSGPGGMRCIEFLQSLAVRLETRQRPPSHLGQLLAPRHPKA
jgi:SMI1 / KNR4 family (SUKH-1)